MAGLALDAWAARVPPPRPSSAKAQGQDVDGDPVDHGEPPAIAVNGEQVATAPPSVAPVASTESATVPSGPAAGVWRPGTTPSPPRPLERLAAAAVTGALLGAAAANSARCRSWRPTACSSAGWSPLSVADIRVGLVPRKLVYPTLALLAVALWRPPAVAGDWRPLGDAAIGGAAGFAVFFAIWWIYPAGHGVRGRAAGRADRARRSAGSAAASSTWASWPPSWSGSVVGSWSRWRCRAPAARPALPFGPALGRGRAWSGCCGAATWPTSGSHPGAASW